MERKTKRSIDLPGISVLTGGLILFVYAISDGAEGWGRPQIIVTLIFSIFFFVGCCFVERIAKDPAVPPRIWFNKNFAVMFFMLGASTGIVGGISALLTGTYGHRFPRRIHLLVGQHLMVVGTILFALADIPEKYWSHIFPGVILDMFGVAMSYVSASLTTMAGAPQGEEGVIGAILYTSFQVGSTIAIAIASSITLSVNQKLPMHAGYAASLWSVLGMHGLIIIITVLFVRD